MKKIVLLVLTLVLFFLGGCATAPTHKVLKSASLPKLIPLREFVANIQSNFNFQVSPDGKKIAWIAVKGTKLTIHFRDIDTVSVQTINTHSNRSLMEFSWAQDSRTLLYHQDKNGDENHHVYRVSIDRPDAMPVDLTPLQDAKATIVKIPSKDPGHIFIQHNQRDKSVFDLFRLDLKSSKLEQIAQNPGDVTGWLIDDSGQLRGRYRKPSDTVERLEALSADGKQWREIIDWKFDDTFYVLDFTSDPDYVWVVSNIGRDKTALLKLDVRNSKTSYVYSDQTVDLESVYISQVTYQPVLATSMPDYPRIHFFDDDIGAEFERLKQQYKGFVHIVSTDYAERTVVFALSTDKQASHYLYQRDTGKVSLLGTHPLSRHASILATTKPIAFKSRDGLLIHGYVTLPNGLEGKKTPLVLSVHGGPWARNRYGLYDRVQFLANRGYAVLQVNYRGSSGYGKRFREAAIGEFAGKMHTDLIDGVNWAISQGIADREKVCIMGGSYGGYATLVGMAFTPDVFACGVDVVGPSNLATLLKNTPAYWKHGLPFWHKYVGNPDNPEQRKDMEGRSPLFKVDAIRSPLLIVQGANDPRVKQLESDQMVKALRESGKVVEYLLFENEGHGISRWTNNLVFYRIMEDFLAKYLGGRSAGFDYYELGTFLFDS